MRKYKTRGIDPACEALAEHFLRDDPVAHPDAKLGLSSRIQQAVEDWYEQERKELDPVSGGLVRVPPGVDQRHVLLKDHSWGDLDSAPKAMIREFGGCMLLGNGQMVPAQS